VMASGPRVLAVAAETNSRRHFIAAIVAVAH